MYTTRHTWINTRLTSQITQQAEGSGTYNFDAVAWSGGECPGACFLAGVFIRPVGAGDGTAHSVHSVIAASCKKTSLSQHRLLHHAIIEQSDSALKLFLTQVSICWWLLRWGGNGKQNVQPHQKRWGEIPSLQSCLFSCSTKPLLHWQL